MIVKSKLDKSFGPIGSQAGLILFIAGIAICFKSLTGIILILIGAFMAFTSTSTVLDVKNKKIKHADKIFGIIRLGKWINIVPGMKLVVKKVHKGYRSRSRSNRTFDVHINDIRIVLYGFDGKQIMHVKKFDSLETAQRECRQLASELALALK